MGTWETRVPQRPGLLQNLLLTLTSLLSILVTFKWAARPRDLTEPSLRKAATVSYQLSQKTTGRVSM